MNSFLNFSKKSHELPLIIIIILYIVLNVPTPEKLIPYINNPLGNVVIFVVAVSTFFHSNALTGILVLFAAYVLIKRSSHVSFAIENYIPSEKNKMHSLNKMNEIEKTLEEEMVNIRAPFSDSILNESSFSPLEKEGSLNTSLI
jgi:hypothetical protein